MTTIIETKEQMGECLLQLQDIDLIACDLEASELNVRKAKIEGIGFGTKDNQYFIPFPNVFDITFLENSLTTLFKKRVIFHNAKYDIQLLLAKNLPIPEQIDDTMIMSWLVDENRSHGLKNLVKVIFDREPKQYKELNREPDLFRDDHDVMVELGEYCMEDVRNTFLLYEYFLPLLKAEGVDIAYYRVELKFIPILISMELRGIKVDVNWLNQKSEIARKQLAEWEKQIITKIQEKDPNMRVINIRSPKQLEEILFKIFKYRPSKLTDSGKKSTDNEALEGIVKEYKLKEDDVVPLIIKFRDLDKINGTYFESLAEQAGLENTIHTSFLQHGSRTGRISSKEPNLMNQPTRHDEWDVRYAFMAREGYTLIMADYSQMELRVVAHFSQDPIMVETFNNGGDIHAETMKATGATRLQSKAINFGLIYGLGPRTLAKNLEISEETARKYMNRFFTKYSTLRWFIDQVQQRALQIGYVSMITGRRRRFAEYRDNRWYNSIQRMAINTKIQGSAADVIKVAMIRLQPLINKLGAYQLIQVHDELIIECPDNKLEEVKKVVRETMENALKLRVPLVVGMSESKRWVKG